MQKTDTTKNDFVNKIHNQIMFFCVFFLSLPSSYTMKTILLCYANENIFPRKGHFWKKIFKAKVGSDNIKSGGPIVAPFHKFDLTAHILEVGGSPI